MSRVTVPTTARTTVDVNLFSLISVVDNSPWEFGLVLGWSIEFRFLIGPPPFPHWLVLREPGTWSIFRGYRRIRVQFV
jgi:hypothetical protein